MSGLGIPNHPVAFRIGPIGQSTVDVYVLLKPFLEGLKGEVSPNVVAAGGVVLQFVGNDKMPIQVLLRF